MSFQPSSRQGSALVAVIFLATIMGLLTASIISYSISERRSNERQRLVLRARNMAENIALYASEQITTKLYRLRSASPIEFISGGNQVYLPPDDILTTHFSSPSDVELHAGLTSSSGLVYIDPADPANATNPNAGLQVSTSFVPIIAKATMSHPTVGAVTAYAQQDLQVAMIPLFQFAVFYNQDLEISPGADMILAGPVHANGNLIARSQSGFSNTIQFTDRVTAAGGLYANTAHKGPTYNEYDDLDNGPGGSGPLYFQNTAGTVTNIKSSSGTWRDHKYGNSSESATTLNQFKTFATATYTGNLRTSVHGVTPLVLPGVDSNPITNSAHVIIDPPNASDTAVIKQTKISRNAGLYIIANPTGQVRNGTLPDESTVSMPAYSYRCWLNTANLDGTYTLYEITLPGQPSYGLNNSLQNNLPNRLTNLTGVGVNQVLRIPASGRVQDATVANFVYYLTGTPYTNSNYSGAAPTAGYNIGAGVPANLSGSNANTTPDAFFYDQRRANNSKGHPYNRTSSNPFAPRPVAKIDLDMTRLSLAIQRTVYDLTTSDPIFNVDRPSAANWSKNILNSGAGTTTISFYPNGFGMFPKNAVGDIVCDPFKMYFITGLPVQSSDLISASGRSPWYDGVTIYIQSVDAEDLTETSSGSGVRNRTDSGVRLWNGRTPRSVSLSAASHPGRTGLTLATNDALYIVGDFNADGSINSTSTSTANPGGFSARYPDNTYERLSSLMADAITIFSQPTFTSSGGSYYQSSGWSDSLSGIRCRDSNWSSSWFKSNPSSSNAVEGSNQSITPAYMPNLGPGAGGAGSSRTIKFDPAETEISACLLTGIVFTTAKQTSGGLHNYPRLQEDWNGTGLYIRGSMVAMYTSTIATEPWSIRIYSGAGRYWGLHQNLRDAGHDLPLEPVVLNAQRMHYKEITAADYDALKVTIEALPD